MPLPFRPQFWFWLLSDQAARFVLACTRATTLRILATFSAHRLRSISWLSFRFYSFRVV